jgi:hypothetical protein
VGFLVTRIVALFGLMLWLVSMASPGRAEFAEADSPWSATVQTGGTLVMGGAKHYVDGEHIATDKDDLDVTLDLRGSVTRSFHRWFSLSGQLGVTNWNSIYRYDAGYYRSNYFSLAVSPELRLPFGRCVRCPALLAAPRLGFVFSQLGHETAHAVVKESGWAGWGGVFGLRLGLVLRLSARRAFGLKLETGVEKTWLRHEVMLSGIGRQDQSFELTRMCNLVGFWWNL